MKIGRTSSTLLSTRKILSGQKIKSASSKTNFARILSNQPGSISSAAPASAQPLSGGQTIETGAITISQAQDLWQHLQQPIAYAPKNQQEASIVQDIQEMRKNVTLAEIAKASTTVTTSLNGQPVQVPTYVLYAPEWLIVGMAKGWVTPVDY